METTKKREVSAAERRKLYRTAAKDKAKAYISSRHALKTKEERKAFKVAYKAKVNEWKRSLKAVGKTDKGEKAAQKTAFKVFKKRKNRVRRIIIWAAVVCVIALLIVAVAPILSMTVRVLASQSYTDKGEAADAVREAGYALSAEICEEGFVLLKNDDNLLPLTDAKLSIFGDDAYNFVYGGSGSAGADQADAVSLFDAFEQDGIEYNTELDEAYRRMGVATGGGAGSTKEMVVGYFTESENEDDWLLPADEVIASAREYSDTALIVLSSMEVESNEIDLALLMIMGDKLPNRKALIEKVLDSFEHVIFIINSGNVMELGFLDDYDSADAALWVGSPGSLGCHTIADILTGKVNPSGRTVDTYPVSIKNEPSYATYGNNKYLNLNMYTMEYSEGIYVGYRYYETRFGADETEYASNVVFPFGYGLSYTTFTQSITSFTATAESITVTVDVTNNGRAAGKDVVELYFMPPYYEQSGIEKSAIELAAYAKTELLHPNETQTLTLSFDVRDMSSYAKSIDGGCYLLEHGEYRIAIGENVHAALTSIDYQVYNVAEDIKYKTDDATGTEISNLFGFAEGDVGYLSRSDWGGTYPKAKTSYVASTELIAGIVEYEKAEAQYESTGEEPNYDADNGIELADLKGLDYDDPKWELFLDQFTVKEMIKLTANGGWHTEAVERLGVKESRLLDGPSGINSMFTNVTTVAYPMETIVGSSWNDEMALRLGETIGDEAAVYGVNGWYAPAMNIHRSSIGGRNNEYFSEDPLLSGNMAASAVKGAQSRGLIAFMKHFVCNDVELNARSGIVLWVNEQALREIYLRPFELSVKEGGAYGAMSSFSFLGSKWCGGSSELLCELLREEWGFDGMVCTDACLGSWMNAELAVKNGNDLMLEMGLQSSQAKLRSAYGNDPLGVAWGLRNSVHNICYALVNGTNQY